MASTQSLRRYFSIELAIIVIATLLVALVTWRVFSLGIERIIVDQNAHLNLTRQVVDSLTPGLSQIGFWPPLLHLLMVPFVAIRSLYATGLAAVFTLLPFLALGAVFLYRLTLELTGYRLIAFWAALAYLLNPYMLYYTATPMMEVLFMGNLMGAAYFMLRWFRHPRLPNLLFLGMFITLATLSRFEGLILLPLALVIILIQLIRVRASRRRIEALVILFFLVASVGVFTILGYGYMFASDPLAFMNSQWSAFAQQRDYVLPTQGNVGAVITYLLHASYYLFTKPLVIAALVGGALTILLRPRLEIVAVLLVLLSPFLFVAAALYEGNAVLYLPELEPFTSFYNERYGLYWLGFAILAPALVLGIGLDRTRAHRALARPALLAAALVMGLSTAYLARHLYRTAFVDNYAVIQSSLRYPMENQREIAAVLGAEYDFGKILMTRALHDVVALDAGIALGEYIHESNHKFYDSALERPWLFARWVVMQNPSAQAQLPWVIRNEKVALRWGNSKEFGRYYTLVHENEGERLYKVNAEALLRYAAERGLTPFRIPALSPQITFWDPDAVYREMSMPAVIRAKLPDFYTADLRPSYQEGFYVDAENIGTSEGQSYALLQALAMQDKESFARTWAWTKTHLKRKNDRLFSWKFEFSPAADEVRILDENSATDADTDIALALLLAGEAWGEAEYTREALAIINDIWRLETTVHRGERLVTAGNWGALSNDIVLNPSYFAPSSYRHFARYDTAHDWGKVVEDTYDALERITDYQVRVAQYALPPNWVVINKTTDEIGPFVYKNDSLDYSYDAFRTYWRVARDALDYPNERAERYLATGAVFEAMWRQRAELCTTFTLQDKAGRCAATTSTLAGPLSVFSALHPRMAEAVVQEYYLERTDLVVPESAPFYEKSWYWFALQLWSDYTKRPVALAEVLEVEAAPSRMARFVDFYERTRNGVGTVFTSASTSASESAARLRFLIRDAFGTGGE